MPARDYSTTPANNTTIGGLDADENNNPGILNNIDRQLAADLRGLADEIDAIPSALPLAGGTVTGEITRSGRGSHLHHNNPGNASGRIFVQAAGGSAPSMSDGDILLEY